MIDETKYIDEMRELVDTAFSVLRNSYPESAIYTISIWTDAAARRSAVSADTFENSELKCAASNAVWADLRTRFTAEENLKRLSLIPPEKLRNDNPADFQLQKLAVIQNESLFTADPESEQMWNRLDDLLKQVQMWAALKAPLLRLHPDAELGISGRRTWYHSAIKPTA